MKALFRFSLIIASVSSLATHHACAQSDHLRPPAIPLITCDPYFSIWSFADRPTDDWARHWTGAVNALCGMIRVDGRTYRLLGTSPGSVPAMPFTGVTVTPTRTAYEFSDSSVAVTLTFMTPALPYDLNLLSRPVGYVSWQVRSVDGKDHPVFIYFDNTAELSVNTPDQLVSWSRVKLKTHDVLRIGSQDQRVLGRSGDDLRIDWGYLYLVSPGEQHAASVIGGQRIVRGSFAGNGSLPLSDDLRMPRAAQDDWPVLACAIDAGKVGVQPVERFVVLAYDDLYSIEYLQRKLLAYWKVNGMTTSELLERSVREYPALVARCKEFDSSLQSDLRKAGGEQYAQLATLAYRQAIAAHKLAADVDGTPLLFPKENFSNGCISTVDVIYPAAPIFLLFNAELAKASVRPVIEYATTTRWRFPFAPHDLGTYPLANGQVYGGGETGEENQMPVEESANLLLLMYAIARIEGNCGFAEPFWPTLQKWARYLTEKGLDPENQLCTDDFAGHLAHNANLSLKAILALGAYSTLCTMLGKSVEAREYQSISEGFAQRWIAMADDGDHTRLAFDKPGTWSQKYNLVWDQILDLNLFPKAVAQKEIRFYRSKLNTYGLPLDNRKEYTKLDWILWTATLGDQREDFEALVAGAFEFADKTPDRVPLSDWYDTKTAKQEGFQARPVVGGLFIKMLDTPELRRKWRTRH